MAKAGRPKLFSHKYNITNVEQFEDYLKDVRLVYPHPDAPLSIEAILKKQKIILQGKDADTHKHLPKVLNECLQRLRVLLDGEPPLR